MNYDANEIIVKKRGDKESTTRRIRKSENKKGKKQFDKSRNIRLQLARATSECISHVILNLGAKKDFRLVVKSCQEILEGLNSGLTIVRQISN